MSILFKAAKLARLFTRRRFAAGLAAHRIAAAVEHHEAIKFCAPETLIDVGANKGQFSLAAKGLRPNVFIQAFEPVPEAASRFEKLFRGDPEVRLHRFAIGAVHGTSTFYITDREDSSSLLPPGKGQELAFDVHSKREMKVEVRPLDALLDTAELARPVMMKIDVQGAELDVLQGCASLDGIDFIYVELSFVELYEGQSLFEDVRSHLVGRGFELRGVFNQVFTRAFGPTQADCLFVRTIQQ